MVNKKKASKYDDYITNSILGVFGFAFVLIIGLMITYRGYSSLNSYKITMDIVYVLSAVAAAAAIAGLIWGHYSAKKEDDRKYKLVNSKNLTAVSIVTAIVAFIAARYFVDGVKLLYIFIPVAAVLTLIKLVYSSDFFMIALMTSLGGFLMLHMSISHYPSGLFEMTLSEVTGSSIFYLSIAAILLSAAAAILVADISKNDGEIKIAGRKIRIFNTVVNYPLLYLSALLTALTTVIAFVFGAATAYYLIFVMFGYLFIVAFYYTVKLM